MRHLVSIQRIAAIEPIPEADSLELARILGWNVIVRKDENYKVGDLVLYFEIDSFLPAADKRFEFLRKSSYRSTLWQGEGFRLRTMKLRGQLSQGLILPLSDFPEITDNTEGSDVTELLNVTKWDPPESMPMASGTPRPGSNKGMHGNAKGPRPPWIPKTDETRIQSVPRLLKYFAGKPFYVTQKVDGTSTTIYCKDGVVGGCSRNTDIKVNEDCLMSRVIKQYGLFEKLPALGHDIIIQGELCGPGIQKNRMNLKHYCWFVFDALRDGEYLGFSDLSSLVESLGLTSVPLIATGTSFPEHTIESLLKLAEEQTYPDTDHPAEGIVVRTSDAEYDKEDPILREIGRPSFKAINNQYLLKCGD